MEEDKEDPQKQDQDLQFLWNKSSETVNKVLWEKPQHQLLKLRNLSLPSATDSIRKCQHKINQLSWKVHGCRKN